MIYKRKFFIWLLCFLIAAITILTAFRTVQAADSAAAPNSPSIENTGSDFQPVEPEKPKTKLTPSSTGMGETTDILIRFMILWSIIYLVIKFVRMWLDKHK